MSYLKFSLGGNLLLTKLICATVFKSIITKGHGLRKEQRVNFIDQSLHTCLRDSHSLWTRDSDLLGQVASSVGGVEDLVIEY